MTLPQIKKKISSFLLGEEGQISKKVVVGLGVILAGVAVETAKAWTCQAGCGADCEKCGCTDTGCGVTSCSCEGNPGCGTTCACEFTCGTTCGCTHTQAPCTSY